MYEQNPKRHKVSSSCFLVIESDGSDPRCVRIIPQLMVVEYRLVDHGSTNADVVSTGVGTDSQGRLTSNSTKAVVATCMQKDMSVKGTEFHIAHAFQ